MSQREGVPRSRWSEFLLRLMSCMTCSEPQNEWTTVWNPDCESIPPEGVRPYRPRVVRKGFDAMEHDTPLFKCSRGCSRE